MDPDQPKDSGRILIGYGLAQYYCWPHVLSEGSLGYAGAAPSLEESHDQHTEHTFSEWL